MMRYFRICSKTTYLSVFIACTMVFCLVSCKKKNPNADVASSTILSVYNFSPTVATYDVYLKDAKINPVPLPFAGGVKYQQFTAGTYDVNFNIATSNINIFKKTFNFPSAGVSGTLYFVGKKNTFDAFYVSDAYQGTTNADKSYIRFVNVCADAPSMSLEIKDGKTLAKDQEFKSNSAFVEIDPGTYTFLIKETGSGTLKTDMPGSVLSAGVFYTLAIGGNYTPADDNERPVTGALILHK